MDGGDGVMLTATRTRFGLSLSGTGSEEVGQTNDGRMKLALMRRSEERPWR